LSTDVPTFLRSRFVNIPEAQALIADVGGRLTPAEQRRLDGFQFRKRRDDWLLGRLVAKQAVSEAARAAWGVDVAPAEIEIASRDSGAPVAVNRAANGRLPVGPGDPLPVTLSISHSAGAAFCAASWSDEPAGRSTRLGVDVELVTTRPHDLFYDHFTPDELRYCTEGGEVEGHLRSTLVWSIKESVLKAFGLGLTIDTRAISCVPAEPSRGEVLIDDAGEWRSIAIVCRRPLVEREVVASALWRTSDQFVLTVVAL
jgi:phosphopantetheinyl transferase